MYELTILFAILALFSAFLAYQFKKLITHMKALQKDLRETKSALETSQRKEQVLQERLTEMLIKYGGLR